MSLTVQRADLCNLPYKELTCVTYRTKSLDYSTVQDQRGHRGYRLTLTLPLTLRGGLRPGTVVKEC